MQIEHIARVRLAACRSPQEQRDLTVRPGVLAQIVIDDERVFALPHEVLAHCAAREWGEVPQRRRVLSRNGHDDGVLHRAFLLEHVDDLGNGRRFLPHRHVDAGQVATALVDDRVQSDSRLARLSVANDQLALSAANGDHRVDRLDARLDRLIHRRPQHDARCNDLDRPRRAARGVDRPFAIEWLAQRIDDSPNQFGTDGHRRDAASTPHLVALLDLGVWPDDHHADGFLFEVQGDAHHVLLGELHQLERSDVAQPVDARDPIADLHDRADLARLDRGREVRDLLDEDGVDFFGGCCHCRSLEL